MSRKTGTCVTQHCRSCDISFGCGQCVISSGRNEARRIHLSPTEHWWQAFRILYASKISSFLLL